jgi:hypothetical protein
VPVPSFYLLPTFKEEGDFGFSTDQGCQSSGHRHIETPPGSTFLEDSIHGDRLSHTSEGLGSYVLALKISLHQAIGRVTTSTVSPIESELSFIQVQWSQ